MPFNSLVLAQAETAQSGTPQSNFVFISTVVIFGFVLPFLAGKFLAKQYRSSEYGWKISLVLILLALAAMTVARSFDPATRTFKIPLGVDLKGGVILIYEVADESLDGDGTEGGMGGAGKMDALISALSRRINPSGTKEIVLRKYGDQQVEIIIPEVDPLEVEVIKKQISTAGLLKFRIVANRRDHDEIFTLATEMAADPAHKRSTIVRDAGNRPVGLWARVAREQAQDNVDQPLKLAVSSNDLVRDASTGDLLDWTKMAQSNARDQDAEIANLQKFLDEQGIKEIDVLMATDDGYNVEGKHLGVVSQAKDERLNPCINFSLRGEGIDLFADLTRDNKPDGTFHRQLGILLDNELLSAPNIQEMINRNGRITGKFTKEEVAFMVNILDAGSLPVVLNPIPISENVISPLLGQQTIEQGKWAIAISLSAVLIFILFYYRYAGIVAAMALLVNLLFILALMITIKAAFTLPGLAGLVLTVGMSVDANVLIFERIREEITKGSAQRMAIRNGFGKATTTIVDANVTTLITAIVLYAIGTDQIRGFAVTLILGILMSMLTAIFCSRIIFDLAEKSRRLSLAMSQIVGTTQIDFIGKRTVAAAFSCVLIAAGIAGLTLRGADIFDIDFRGGTSVHLTLDEAMKTDDVRAKLEPKFKAMGQHYTISAMNAGGNDANKVFKVDSGIAEVEDLQAAILDALKQSDGTSPLATYSLEYDGIRTVAMAGAKPTTEAPEPGAPDAVEKPGNETVVPPKATPAEAASPPSSEPAAPEPAAPEPAAPEPAAPATPAPATPPAPAPEPAPAVDATPDSDAPKTPATPAPATPAPTTPAPTTPAPTTPAPTTPAPTTPAPTTPAPTTPAPTTPAPTTPAPTTPAPATPAPGEGARALPSLDNVLAMADDLATLVAQADTDATPAGPPVVEPPPAAQPPTTEASSDAAPVSSDEKKPTPPADAPPADATPAVATPADSSQPKEPSTASPPLAAATQVEVDLAFAHGINYETLHAMVEAAMEAEGESVFFDLQNPNWQGGSNTYDTWTLQIPGASQAQAEQLLVQLQSQFADKPIWQASSKIGRQVSGRMQSKAIFAFLTCLLGIILYIWIRFQRVIFGLAAVVALVHDVLVTLGAIALSFWLAKYFGFLLIEEFKISLPIVAALLTIIGYSLNDTIVVFDRIREVRGKSPDLTGEMINTSINQTLSRTILTSLTTLIVVLILYAIGGDGIHGFAFALVVGVTVGTYSSIFVASPVLLWMTGANKSRQHSGAA